MWLSLIFFLPALGQTLLPEVSVESKTLLLEKSSAPVYRVSEEELQQSTDLDDVLTEAPGVMFAQSGGAGGVGSLYLRGSGSQHTLVLIDGHRLNDPTNVNRSFDTGFLQTPFFEEVLFSRGPAPALYGSDAIGGVIELSPRRGRQTKESVLSLSAGSFDTFQGFAIQDWSSGAHQGSVGLSHFQTRGISRLNRKRHGASEADGAVNTQLMQASRHQWSEALATDLLFYGYQARAEQDSTTADTTGDRTDNQLGHLSQTTYWRKFWLKAGVTSQTRDSVSTSLADETYRGELRLLQLGHEFTSANFTLTSGVEAQQEWQASPNVNKQNDLGALFALGRYDWAKLSLEVGARGEHHQRYGDFFTPESTLSYYPSDQLKWHTKVSRGYKSPSLYQLYAPDTFGPLGNSELTPETNKSMELGVTWKSAGTVSVVAFQQDYQNLILYSSTDGYLNGGDLRVQGIESQVVSPMYSWGQVSVSWTQLDFSNFDETPIRRPPYLATLNWSQEWGKWKSELRLRAVGGRKDRANSKNVSLIAYETLSGTLRYEATQNQQWVLNAGNLTDREYEDIWGYSVAPLNLSLQWLGKF